MGARTRPPAAGRPVPLAPARRRLAIVRHAGAWFTSPPGAATFSEETSAYRPKPKNQVAAHRDFSWPPACVARSGRPELVDMRSAPTPSPEHSKAYRLGSDPARAEGGYRYSANVSLTALLTTNGDADLCIKDAADRTRSHRQDRKQLAGSETWAHSAGW